MPNNKSLISINSKRKKNLKYGYHYRWRQKRKNNSHLVQHDARWAYTPIGTENLKKKKGPYSRYNSSAVRNAKAIQRTNLVTVHGGKSMLKKKASYRSSKLFLQKYKLAVQKLVLRRKRRLLLSAKNFNAAYYGKRVPLFKLQRARRFIKYVLTFKNRGSRWVQTKFFRLVRIKKWLPRLLWNKRKVAIKRGVYWPIDNIHKLNLSSAKINKNARSNLYYTHFTDFTINNIFRDNKIKLLNQGIKKFKFSAIHKKTKFFYRKSTPSYLKTAYIFKKFKRKAARRLRRVLKPEHVDDNLALRIKKLLVGRLQTYRYRQLWYPNSKRRILIKFGLLKWKNNYSAPLLKLKITELEKKLKNEYPLREAHKDPNLTWKRKKYIRILKAWQEQLRYKKINTSRLYKYKRVRWSRSSKKIHLRQRWVFLENFKKNYSKLRKNTIASTYSLTVANSRSNYFLTLTKKSKQLTDDVVRVYSSGKIKLKNTTRKRRDIKTYSTLVLRVIRFLQSLKIRCLSTLNIKVNRNVTSRSSIKRRHIKTLTRFLRYTRIKVRRVRVHVIKSHGLAPRRPKRRRK